jgi:hypothetical protein
MSDNFRDDVSVVNFEVRASSMDRQVGSDICAQARAAESTPAACTLQGDNKATVPRLPALHSMVYDTMLTAGVMPKSMPFLIGPKRF